jgi:tetratricopeptide (TPR) repeat protein
MSSFISRALSVSLAALATSLVAGCQSPPSGAPPTEGGPAASQPPAAAPDGSGGGNGDAAGNASVSRQPHAPLGGPCEEMLVRLRDIDVLVPIAIAQAKRSQEQLNNDAREGIALARRFLAECPGTEPTAEVRALLARLLLARGGRHREEEAAARQKKLKDSGLSPEEIEEAWKAEKEKLDGEMAAYHEEARILARLAAGSREDRKARLTGLFVLMKLADQQGRFEDARRLARELFAEDPDHPNASSIHISTASGYLSERRYKEAAEHLRGVIEKREADPEYVVYNDLLFNALTGLGDLEGMEDLAHRIRAEYPDRMQGQAIEYYRGLYEQWYYNALFWIGFVRMALGDVDGAKAAFRESIAEVEALEARLKPEGKVLNNVIKIYLDNRTRDLLQYLEDLHGKPPATMDEKGVARPLDFDLGPYWATEEKLTLEGSRGKVVAAVCQTQGWHEGRSPPFLQAIDRLVKERSADGLRGVWLSFLTGRKGPEEDARALAALRDERKTLGVSLPAGYDPDRVSQQLFRSLHATVGTSTFFVFDRNGCYAWYMSDPLGRDVQIARRVIARILAEK